MKQSRIINQKVWSRKLKKLLFVLPFLLCSCATSPIGTDEDVHLCDANTQQNLMCEAHFGEVWLLDPLTYTKGGNWQLRYKDIDRTKDRADNIFYPIICTYYLETKNSTLGANLSIFMEDGTNKAYNTKLPILTPYKKLDYSFTQTEVIPPFNDDSNIPADFTFSAYYEPGHTEFKIYMKCDQYIYEGK